jgi:hypothetical protein
MMRKKKIKIMKIKSSNSRKMSNRTKIMEKITKMKTMKIKTMKLKTTMLKTMKIKTMKLKTTMLKTTKKERMMRIKSRSNHIKKKIQKKSKG